MFSCLQRTLCCSSRKCRRENKIYVLKLTDKKFYVGESNNIERRIWVHQNENGSACIALCGEKKIYIRTKKTLCSLKPSKNEKIFFFIPTKCNKIFLKIFSPL